MKSYVQRVVWVVLVAISVMVCASFADDFGDLPSPYATLSANNGPSHKFSELIYLGTTMPDSDQDGLPSVAADGDDTSGADDEDAIEPANVQCFVGYKLDVWVRATNLTGSTAEICGFADWNADGDFADANEAFIVPVVNGANQQLFYLGNHVTVPPNATTTQPIALRLRISSKSSLTEPSLGAAGSARDGEVEDYFLAPALNIDSGDLPGPSYPTPVANDGPRHRIVAGLCLGQTVDGEPDGIPSVDALGDDEAALDDEDGFDPASVVPQPGSELNTPVRVTTPSDSGARVYGFADWNNDGDFGDEGERSSAYIPPSQNNTPVNLAWNVPQAAVVGSKLAVRLRLLAVGSFYEQPQLMPGGYASSGEVEDYQVYIPTGQRDFGDLPDALPGIVAGTVVNSSTVKQGDYQTRLAEDGPRHKIRPDLSLFDAGDAVDAELDGQPSATAEGDNLSNLNDETDAQFAVMKLQPSNITPNSIDVTCTLLANLAVDNRTGQTAHLTGFIDSNNDGDFSDTGESAAIAVPSKSGCPAYNLEFTFKMTIKKPTVQWTIQVPARFRLSTQQGLDPSGAAPDGEVEDYITSFSFSCNPWWESPTDWPLLDKGSSARIKAPASFGVGASGFDWAFGSAGGTSGGSFNASGASPLLLPSQLSNLPAGQVPYSITARRSDTAVDCFLGFATVKDLPNFRSFMQRTPSIAGENAAPSEDPDRDGRSNFTEYAQGTDPSKGDTPQFYPAVSTNRSFIALTVPYLRRVGGTNMSGGYMTSELVYQPEGSADLSAWNLSPTQASAPSSLPAPPSNYEWGAVSVQLTNTARKGFIRVRAGVR